MNRVIKVTDPSGAAAVRVRPPSLRSEPRFAPVDAERLALLAEREAVASRLALQEQRIVELEAECESKAADAFRAGEEQGHAAGLKEGADLRDEALNRLETGVKAALEQFNRELMSMEQLAVELARDALTKLIGDPTQSKDLLVAAIRHQVGQIEAQRLLRVEVSPVDFPDAEKLAELAAAIGCQHADVVSVRALPAASCRIKLELGALDVGLDQQWSRLSAVFDEMAAPARGV